MSEESHDICARMQRESSRAYEALMAYLNMGPKRSYRAVSAYLHKNLALISRWGKRWNWQERAFAWDQKTQERNERIREEIMREMLEKEADDIKSTKERHRNLSKMVQSKALEYLNRMDTNASVSPGVVTTMLREAITIEREALGLTGKVELSGPNGSPISISQTTNMRDLSDEDLLAIIVGQKELTSPDENVEHNQ